MEDSQSRQTNITRLPKINLKKFHTCVDRRPTKLGELSVMEQDSEDVQKLDEWSSSVPTAKRKRNQTSESIVFLYKNNNKYQSQAVGKSRFQDSQMSSISLFLAQLDSELLKIKKINYGAIYQNIEYCKGMYENAFNGLLRTLQKHHTYVEELMQHKSNEIISLREQHMARIAEMAEWRKEKPLTDKTNSSLMSSKMKIRLKNEDNESHQQKIAALREQIEAKEEELRNVKKVLLRVQQAKTKVLKFSLELGYDIREDGLVWILKELSKPEDKVGSESECGNHEYHIQDDEVCSKQKQDNSKLPRMHQFPHFLTQEEIQFIICKFKNNFKLQKIEEEKDLKAQEEKAIIQLAYANMQRDKNRKLSMIKEKELVQRLDSERRTERVQGHKYLSADTLRIVQANEHTKATKYEIIYQETIRKLNRLCVEEIYGKGNRSVRRSSVMRSDKIMKEVKNMLSDVTKLKEESDKIKTEEEKQLSVILKKLREERYSAAVCSEQRNPISVIGCLVGWKKARKIVENEINITLASSF